MTERLGSRALTYFRIWIMALLWTVSYSEGAGFGAATYRNECVHRQLGLCPLVYHALFPPRVPAAAFVGNLATLWVDGLYDTGLLFAVVISIILVLIASRMTWHAIERATSWPVIAMGCLFSAPLGYFYEIQQTLRTGVAGVPLL